MISALRVGVCLLLYFVFNLVFRCVLLVWFACYRFGFICLICVCRVCGLVLWWACGGVLLTELLDILLLGLLGLLLICFVICV